MRASPLSYHVLDIRQGRAGINSGRFIVLPALELNCIMIWEHAQTLAETFGLHQLQAAKGSKRGSSSATRLTSC